MRRIVGRIVLAVAVMIAPSVPVAAGPYEDGVTAFEQEKYEVALQLMRPLAENGISEAQFVLGQLYAEGTGIVKDYEAAYMWLTLAARQGHSEARTVRDDLAARLMGHGEITEARQMVREWKPKTK